MVNPMSQNQHKRRGNAMIVGLSLIPLLGFGALSVDIGLQRMTSLQLQMASEAASLAGASQLNGTDAGITAAEAYALEIANLNKVYPYTDGGAFEAADVVAGIYDPVSGFVAYDGSQDPATVNSVQVGETENVTSILSGASFGISTLAANGKATSYQPRRGVPKYVDCYLPFAIPSCLFQGYDADGDNRADGYVPPKIIDLTAGGGNDNGGWGMPTQYAINTPAVIAQMLNTCAAGQSGTDDDLGTGNGANWTVMQGTVVDVLKETVAAQTFDDDGPLDVEGNTMTWPTARDGTTAYTVGDSRLNMGSLPIGTGDARWGNSIAGPIPIINMGTVGACSGLSFAANTDYDIVGWAYAYVFDVSGIGGDKSFFMQFDFENQYDIGTGMCVEDPSTTYADCLGNLAGTGPSEMVL